MLRVVIDSNNFIRSLLNKNGPCAEILDLWREGYYTLITSHDVIQEIQKVVNYPRISKKYNINKSDVDSLINAIEREALIISDLPEIKVILEDPDDNKFIACALKAKAHFIVSGDHHLLNLGQHQNIPIVTARRFLEIIS